jgi:PKD repeat protein
MKKILKSLLLLCITSTAYALDCPIPVEANVIQCKGNKKVNSIEEVNLYLTDYAVNSEGYAKNLIIDFDLELGTSDIQVSTPCKIVIKENRKILSTGSICINGKEGVRIKSNSIIRAKDIHLTSQKRVAIKHHADIKAEKVVLDSTGKGHESRVHIRHNSNISANSLTLNAYSRATLGHTSNYNITDKLILNSTNEFSAIWKGTQVQAESLLINSGNKVSFSKKVTLTSNSASISAPECTFKKADINISTIKGNCFVTGRPTAKLKVESITVNTGNEVVFDASKSKDDKGIVKYIWSFPSEEVVETKSPIYKKTFVESGIYKVTVQVVDVDGYKSSKTIKMNVEGEPSLDRDPEVYFSFNTTEDSVSLYFHQPNTNNIQSAEYHGEEGLVSAITNFKHRSEITLNNVPQGTHTLTLKVKNKTGEEFSYTHDKILVADQEDLDLARPVIDVKPIQVSPKKVLLDVRKVFDIQNNWLEFYIDWGDGNTSEGESGPIAAFFHEYNNVGTYDVTFYAMNMETELHSEITKTITVTSDEIMALPPVADMFIHQNDFAPHVTFDTNNSYSPNSEIVSVVWDHGDGSLFTGMDKKHTHFYEPGVYDVSLTVIDSVGMQSIQTQEIVIHEAGPPIISLTEYRKNDGNEVQLRFTGLDSQSQISNFKIDWGDGTVEELGTPNYNYFREKVTHTFPEYKAYTVTATLETLRGETAISTLVVDLTGIDNQAPVISGFECHENNPKEATCYLSAHDPDGSIDKIIYNFNDGTVIETTSFQGVHTYAESGAYEVHVTVIDNEGKESYGGTSITIDSYDPVAVLACSSPEKETLECDASESYDPFGYIINYEFSFDDIVISGQNSNLYVEDVSGGVKTVKLILTDNEGNTSEAISNVVVTENIYPVSDFICTSISPLTVQCESSSYDEDGEISHISYDMGDSSVIQNEHLINHRYSSAGTKSVTLKVKDNNGAESTLTKVVSVIDSTPPVALFSCSSLRAREISCDATASYDSDLNDLITYRWEYDGKVSTNKVFSDTLSQGGVYSVTLRLIDSYGKESVLSKNIEILKNLKPVSRMSELPEVINLPYSINVNSESSYDPEGKPLVYEWYINNILVSTSSILDNYSIEEEGVIEIRLDVTDVFNEKATSITNIRVNKKPIADFDCNFNDLNLTCNAENAKDTDGSIAEYQWKVNGVASNGNVVLSKLLNDYGNVLIELNVLDNDNALSKTFKKNVYVPNINLSPQAKFNYFIDDNSLVTLDASYSLEESRGVVAYRWKFDDGSILNTAEPIIQKQFGDAEKISVMLTVVDLQDRESSIDRELNLYKMSVPKPPAQDTSLLGVDSDSNGVRDDVQRYIIARIKGHNLITPVSMKIAAYTQEMLTEASDQDRLNELYKLRHDQLLCLTSIMKSAGASLLFREIQAITYNSKERLEYYMTIRGKLLDDVFIHNASLPEEKYGELCE